ncbi:MAG TPA: hypothetical protein PKX55_15845, partial [Leptospiraceae bacterium]|nr:hypothetical protein [Leptospiraceae bacterium]
MYKWLFLFFLIFIFDCKNPNAISPPKAIKGELDLSNWDFHSPDTDGIVKLDGEWEFYWNEFLDPTLNASDPIGNDSIVGRHENKSFIQVPGEWNKYGYPEEGFVSYKLKIRLPQGKRKFSLYL